jgi:hypothetical protein
MCIQLLRDFLQVDLSDTLRRSLIYLGDGSWSVRNLTTEQFYEKDSSSTPVERTS